MEMEMEPAIEPEIDENHLDTLQGKLNPEDFQGYLLFKIHHMLWSSEHKPNKIKDLTVASLCIERLIQSLQARK